MARPKLYIIHGWTYTVAPWDKTIASLKKQGLAVEMLHVPGLTTPSKKVWTIEEYMRWADRNIPDGAIALGHSNGGRILLNLCAENPKKLSHLILLDSAGVYEPSSKRSAARSISKKFSFLKKVPGLAKVWHKLTGASDYAKAPANMKKTLSNMLDSDKNLHLEKVITPTSILWGSADTITPPHQAEILHQKLSNSTIKIFPDWTHAPYISHPGELAKAIFRAVKQPPEAVTPVAVTQAADVSASLALRKAAEPEVPSTTKTSATLAFKKAAGPDADDTKKRSAALVVPEKRRGHERGSNPKIELTAPKPREVIDELASVDFEHADPQLSPRQPISTASVPSVSKFTKVRRKFGAKNG